MRNPGADKRVAGNADPGHAPAQHLRRYRHRAARSQRGSLSLLFVLTVLVMLAFTGIALDTARVYNRRAELQGVADAAALAAARELDGTATGVSNAVARAATVVRRFKYQYETLAMNWSDDAIEFGTTPLRTGAWRSAGSAAASPAGVYFVKVDTSQLGVDSTQVAVAFMQVIGANPAPTNVIGRAIAGRSAINVTPLALCAMSPNAAMPRAHPGPPPLVELVEYGFRRGVAYDLMQLNPNGPTPVNFLVNPIDPPGSSGNAVHTTTNIVGPFICTGTMAMTKITGGSIRVDSPFPIGELFRQLNSRFDQYDGGMCTPNGAPPDANIRAYVNIGGVPWMQTPPAGQTAAAAADTAWLKTVADPVPTPTGTTAAQFGPLWSYARAVPFAAFSAGVPEPANGYTPFPVANWATLYRPGQPVAVSYPAATPYRATVGANFLAPSAGHRPGARHRRVLNVPLLSCPVGAGNNSAATVLAIGKFFMTVPATATSLSAEFAGIVSAEGLGGPVELFP